jgi:Transposase DDE domain
LGAQTQTLLEAAAMQERIITMYCLCDEFLKATKVVDLPGTGMSTAEVMTTALVASELFGGCFARRRRFLASHGYIPQMLRKSRFNRRLPAVPEGLWPGLFSLLGAVAKPTNPTGEYLVDSCPVPACDTIRIRRCRLYRGEADRGYLASKPRYFFGLRIHLLVTATGQPVEFVLAPGAQADITAVKPLPLDVPEGSTIYAAAAYTEYDWADLLAEGPRLHLVVPRKTNAKRTLSRVLRYLCPSTRKRVETPFSQITSLFARTLRAVTKRCFELKICLAILTFAI